MPTEGLVRSGGELPDLVRAQRGHAMAIAWFAAALLFAGMTIFAGGLGALLWAAAHGAATVLGGVAGLSLLVALVARSRGRSKNDSARRSLDDAWQTVAGEVLQARGDELTAPDLARALQTTPAHAETLLSGLSVAGRVRVSVHADAELGYRVDPSAVAADPAAAATTETTTEPATGTTRPS